MKKESLLMSESSTLAKSAASLRLRARTIAEGLKQGDVLFSPACASFDMFNDYEHRGAEFKRIAREMPD